MTLIKKEAKKAQDAQAHADHMARFNRSRKELLDEFNETYKNVKLPDNLVTPEDHINYIRSVVLGFGKKKTGKESVATVPKKKCLNCGSIKVLRQRDETKETLVWTDEYECLNCKERMVL